MNKKYNRNLFVIFAAFALLAVLNGCSGDAKSNNKANTNSGSKSAADVYAKAAPGAIPPNSLGAPNAPVTLEEFADFQCPTCAAMHPKVQELRAAYGDRLRIIFREFPLKIPAHDKNYEAATAAEAAGMQGKFWDMQNLLFTNQQTWSIDPGYRQTFENYAQKLGLDVEKFKTDMAGLVTKNRVDADLQRASSLNLNSTPTFFINGVQVTQDNLSVEGMKKLIDAELKKAPAQNQPQSALPTNTAGVTNTTNSASTTTNTNTTNANAPKK